MKELKEIFIFIGFTLTRFFKNLLVHLFYLFLVLAVAIPTFFIGYKTFKNHMVFLGFLVILVIINIKIRGVLYIQQLKMNVLFVRFLEDPDGYAQNADNKKLPPDLIQQQKTFRDSIKKKSGFITRRLLAALTALKVNKNDFDIHRYAQLGKSVILTYFFFQLVVILLMWLPFAGISMLFIMGVPVSVQYLVFLLGIFFVYFLNAAIVDPVLALLVVKRLKSMSDYL